MIVTRVLAPIIATIGAAITAFAAMNWLPHRDYARMHWVIFLIGAGVAFAFTRKKEYAPAFICGIVAIVFNPIFPARHNRYDWQTIDLVAGLALLVAAAGSAYLNRESLGLKGLAA
jgi:hypothetical protein